MFSCLNLGASVEKLEVSGRYPQILGNSLRFMDNMGLTWHFVHCKILLELMGRLQLLKEPSIAVIIYVHITYIYTQYLERERERSIGKSHPTFMSCHFERSRPNSIHVSLCWFMVLKGEYPSNIFENQGKPLPSNSDQRLRSPKKDCLKFLKKSINLHDLGKAKNHFFIP